MEYFNKTYPANASNLLRCFLCSFKRSIQILWCQSCVLFSSPKRVKLLHNKLVDLFNNFLIFPTKPSFFVPLLISKRLAKQCLGYCPTKALKFRSNLMIKVSNIFILTEKNAREGLIGL